MIGLLDANVLIALFDGAHVHHQKAHRWLAEHRAQGWATCPLTQAACLRVISHAAYPGRLSVADIARRLGQATRAPDHHFWPDSLSLCEPGLITFERILTPKPLTDVYLLALAVSRQGRLVTFDRAIAMSAVPAAGEAHLEVLA